MRVVADPDPARFRQTDQLVWFDPPTGWGADADLGALPVGRRFALESDDPDADRSAYAAIWGDYDLRLTIPGPLGTLRSVPVPGLTWVGVHPDERRRGGLTTLLRDHFARRREAGVVALHASESTIYGRHGYGVASQENRLDLPAGTPTAAPHLREAADGVRTRLVSLRDPGVPQRIHAIAQLCAGDRLGSVLRPEANYVRLSLPRPSVDRDREPPRVLLAQRDGRDVGFAWFVRTQQWQRGVPTGELIVFELWGDPAAEYALLRRLLAFDLVGQVQLRARGVDDRVLQWVGTKRGVAGDVTDSLWLRLVDLPRALRMRGWAEPCDVTIDVGEDAPCPHNSGAWRLRVGADGCAEVTRHDGPADVALNVQTLASAYLGQGALPTKLEAGLIAERRPGAVLELHRALATPTAPIGSVGF